MSFLANNIKRFFKRIGAAEFGIVGSVITILCELLLLLGIAISGNYDNGLYELLTSAINVIFYIFILRYFVRARETKNLRIIAIALGTLAIFDYILPTISSLIGGLVLSGFAAVGFYSLVSGAIFGILYFIFLILEMTRKIKKPYVWLIIFGSFILASSILSSAFSIYLAVESIDGFIVAVDDPTSYLYIFYAIYYILSAIAGVCFGLVYLFYPVLKLRDERRGY